MIKETVPDLRQDPERFESAFPNERGVGSAPIGIKKILGQNPPRGRRRGEQPCSRNHSGGASSLFSEAVSHFASLKDLALTSAGVEIFNDSGVEGSAFSAGKGTEVDAPAGVPRQKVVTSQVGQ